MDLSQLANLGEFIGGVAVLVTLLYLAMQVRQTNLLAKADSTQRAFANYSSWRQMLADEGINALWLRSLNDEELSREDEHRLYVVMCELAYAAVAALANSQAARNAGLVRTTARGVARELESGRLRSTWTRVAENLTASGFGDFANAVADQFDSHARLPPTPE